MYTSTWNKYLPVIKILLKRSLNGEQVLGLDRTDFDKMGPARKTGFKFNIQINKGRVDNLAHPGIAKELISLLQQETQIREMFRQNDYQITMNTKFQLGIKLLTKEPVETEAVAEVAG